MENFDLKKYLAEGRINLNEVEGDKEEGGTYRVYMNSDMDEPKRIDYERYFGDGTKEEMVQQAKKMAYSNDPTNQYGDPILVVVTHEDDIDDVAWSSEDIHDELNSLVDEFEDIDESVNEAAIPKLEKELEKVILKYMKDDEHTIPNITQTVKLFPFSKFAKYYKTKKAAGLAEPQVEGKVNESVNEGYSLEGKDLDLLKSLKNQIDQGVLDSKKKDEFVALLTGLIDTNVTPTDLEEGMSVEGIVKSIEDIRDSLESGESDGIPLDNETEALLHQELERLKGMLRKGNGEFKFPMNVS